MTLAESILGDVYDGVGTFVPEQRAVLQRVLQRLERDVPDQVLAALVSLTQPPAGSPLFAQVYRSLVGER